MRGEVRNPTTVWLLAVVTFGLYGLYILSKMADELRRYLGGEDITPVRDVLLTCLTLGYYGARKYGPKLAEAQRRAGVADASDRGMSFWAQSLLLGYGLKRAQEELNRVWESGGSDGPATFG